MFQVILNGVKNTGLFFNTNDTDKIVDWLNLQLFENKGDNLGLRLNEDWNCVARKGTFKGSIIISGDEDFKELHLVEVKPIEIQ